MSALRPGRWAWERLVRTAPEVTGSTLMVALVLATYADADGTNARPGQELIATDTGLSTRQIRRLLGELEELGWIVCLEIGRHKGARNVASDYVLVIPSSITSPAGDHILELEETDIPQPDTRVRSSDPQPDTGVRPNRTPVSAHQIKDQNTPLPTLPETVPAALAQAWEGEGISSEDHRALFALLTADGASRSLIGRGSSAGWISTALPRLEAGRHAERAVARRQLEATQPRCEHGTPAGRAPAPHDSTRPLCPGCIQDGVSPRLEAVSAR